MSFVLQPWELLLAILSSLVYRRQQQIIQFRNSEIEALLKVLGNKRIPLTDDQRRLLLAVKGQSLGRKTLWELSTIMTTRAEMFAAWKGFDFAIAVVASDARVESTPRQKVLQLREHQLMCVQSPTRFRVLRNQRLSPQLNLIEAGDVFA